MGTEHLYALVLCYFTIGFLFAAEHWYEYHKSTFSLVTTIQIDWPWFLFKLFFWPLYIAGVILLIVFLLLMNLVLKGINHERT